MIPPKIYGLIGYPVKHSLSPFMHNAAFRALNIDAEYRLFPKIGEALEDFFGNLRQNNIYGLNVTVPYKEIVMPFLDKLSEEAKLIGAVNTIKISHNNLEGFNTDGKGFLRHITDDLGFNPQGKNIAIIGAGGAAKAVLVYLNRQKPKSISIYDIEKTRLIALANHLKTNFKPVKIKAANSIEELDIAHADLLVNATPMGMKESDPCSVNRGLIHKDLLVYDLIYNPPETRLIKIAKEKGARTSNGLGMLLYQGMFSFEIWTGKSAPKEVMQKALLEALEG